MNKKTRGIVLALIVFLGGCAGMVTSNDGERVIIEHDGFISMESARSIALQSCEQAGKKDAKHIATANKNPRFAAGFGVQLSTFQCI